MNPDALLALISELYANLATATSKIAQLEAALSQANETDGAPSA